MSYAIDRDSINKALYGNLLVPAYAYLSNQSVFHLDIQDSYDPDKAKSLAKEVLGSNTADLNMIIRSSSADSYNLKAVAEYLKEAFTPLGINLSIEILDSSVYNDRQKSDNYNLGLTVSGVNNGDPASNFKQYFATTGDSNTTYNYHYSNPEFDKLIESAPTIADFDERAKSTIRFKRCYEDMPVIPMFYEINVNIHNVAIKNYAGRTFGVGLPTIEWA